MVLAIVTPYFTLQEGSPQQLPPLEEGRCTLGDEAATAVAKGHYEMEAADIGEFWEPAEKVEDLYNQLYKWKFHEIPKSAIV